MDKIIEIDRPNLVAVVQPGIINAALKAAVAAEGLFYPPDPASFEQCSIGGNLGTNAGGLCCVKYGQTRESVLGLEVVMADGTVIRTGGKNVKDVAGYSLTHLIDRQPGHARRSSPRPPSASGRCRRRARPCWPSSRPSTAQATGSRASRPPASRPSRSS